MSDNPLEVFMAPSPVLRDQAIALDNRNTAIGGMTQAESLRAVEHEIYMTNNADYYEAVEAHKRLVAQDPKMWSKVAPDEYAHRSLRSAARKAQR
jgi:hypothetical protein